TSSDLNPVGPGRATPGPANVCPGFETDPAAWFAWLASAIEGERPIDEAVRAATWTDRSGHAWRVVVTEGGPEVRPAFGNPFLIAHDLPLVSAILVAPPLVHVELTWRHGQEVARIGVDEAPILDLGLAMLTATELPHESITRLGQDTWQRVRSRWERMLATESPPIN
ncbi:MAG: hypothetical protein KY392_03330, partial [Chloroflexi bacterium]|nr:hypothetical protein [Chloroflexota bacterium]